MSFVGHGLGAALDWGDLFPRKARRALGLLLLTWIWSSSDAFSSAVREVAERRAAGIVKLLPTQVSPTVPPSTPAAPTHVAP